MVIHVVSTCLPCYFTFPVQFPLNSNIFHTYLNWQLTRHTINIDIFHFFSVPSSSPNNFTVFSVSSTSIEVLWEDVPEIDENGVIIAYEILYIPLETFNGKLVPELVNTSASNSSVTLNNLEEYVFYNISVRAYTSIGAGPFSPFITQRTLEDSKLCNVLCL